MEATEKIEWFIEDNGYYAGAVFKNVYVVQRGREASYVVDVRVFKRSEEEDIKAAKLIAAAPELLEALKDAYMVLYGGNSVSLEDAMKRMPLSADGLDKKICAAIKKATL